MTTLTKYVPLSEKELHIIIQKELDAVEEGLRECFENGWVNL